MMCIRKAHRFPRHSIRQSPFCLSVSKERLRKRKDTIERESSLRDVNHKAIQAHQHIAGILLRNSIRGSLDARPEALESRHIGSNVTASAESNNPFRMWSIMRRALVKFLINLINNLVKNSANAPKIALLVVCTYIANDANDQCRF